MIDPKELRIGNYTTIGKVAGIYPSMENTISIFIDGTGFSFDSKDIDPIIITPEILTQWCGFESTETEGVYTGGERKDIRVSVGALAVNIPISGEWFVLTMELDALHNLQNWWYMLTGKELEIKIPVKA